MVTPYGIRFWSILVQVMACCLKAPNCYQFNCHQFKVLSHSFLGNVYWTFKISIPQLCMVTWSALGRRQAIFWTKAGILLIGLSGTNFSEILIEILTFSFKKMSFKVSSAKWRPFCLGQCVMQSTEYQVLSWRQGCHHWWHHWKYFHFILAQVVISTL